MTLSEKEQFQLEYLRRNPVINKDKTLKISPEQERAELKSKEREQKKKAPRWKADEELDLHDHTVDEALARVEIVLEHMIKSRLRCLRIIHGGTPGDFGPIQKAIKRQVQSKWRSKIENWTVEIPNQGSMLLLLKSS